MRTNFLKIKTIIQLIVILLGFTASSEPFAAQDVWDVLRSQFVLNHEVYQPEVQQQIRWISTHPSYLLKLTRQSEPYIYHIVTEIKKRKLPGELALIPMIESSYDPFVFSGSGAAGLWQLMPQTGRELGLKQDWWFDARKSIRPSTDAALNYLAYLNRFFYGNWILAIAAYDSGEGTIDKAIKMAGKSRNNAKFWNLKVPQETRNYVPRFLALAEVIKNPKRYGINLPNIPYLPYFEEVELNSQINLNHAARLAGISYKEIRKLNPGYKRSATAPNRPFKILLPKERVHHFNRNLASLSPQKLSTFDKYTVKQGDNIKTLAYRFNTSADLIRDLNFIKSDKLTPGDTLLIPQSKKSGSDTNEFDLSKLSDTNNRLVHVVKKHESYELLEKKYNITAGEIRFWNRLRYGKKLQPGMKLVVYKRDKQPKVVLIKKGDTLSQIAKSNHTTVAHILSQNPMVKKSLIKPGQKLVI